VVRGRAIATSSKILHDENGTPYFPWASQNVGVATAMMQMMPP
jgi:hypothetical protein